MKKIKKITTLIVVITMVMSLLSGCTTAAEGKALYDAMVKSQAVKTSQNDMQFVLRLDASGIEEQDIAVFEQVKAMLNGARFSMNMKQSANENNTAVKAEGAMNMFFGGLSMDMGVWVDMDLSTSPAKFVEIIKLPPMMTAMDPTMAGKEYMVMDFSQMFATPAADGQISDADYAATLQLAKELQEKSAAFLAKYLAQYDPGFKFITNAGTREIATPERTVKADIYQVKLDDKAVKQLIRYSVNNFLNNKDAMEFVMEYMKFIQKFAVAAPGGISPAAGLDKMTADFESSKPALLAEFNKQMDMLEGIQLIGDKGITIEYALDENGYIVSQSGSMDFIFDIAKLDSLEGIKGIEPAAAAIYNIGFDFSVLTYNINKDQNIQMPAVTPENSIDYTEMLKNAVPAQPLQPLPQDQPIQSNTTIQ